MIAIWILLGVLTFITGVIILHFVSFYVVNHMFRKYKHETLVKGKRFRFYLNGQPNIMLSRYHNTLYDVDDYDDDEKFARRDLFEFGGMMFSFSHGKDFLDAHDPYCEGKVKYYGLYSIDGEKFWRSFWWGSHLHDNPFIRQKCMGVYLFDAFKMKFIDKRVMDDAPVRVKIPYVSTIKNDVYHDKRGGQQPIKEMNWWYEEYRYESAFLRWLGIGHMFQKHKVYLEFDSSMGLGSDWDSWKGGVYAAGIPIRKDTEPELFGLYKRVSAGNMDAMSRFHVRTKERIYKFIHDDHKY